MKTSGEKKTQIFVNLVLKIGELVVTLGIIVSALLIIVGILVLIDLVPDVNLRMLGYPVSSTGGMVLWFLSLTALILALLPVRRVLRARTGHDDEKEVNGTRQP